MISASFPSLLQSFFTDRLVRQRHASPNTIAGYRDSFRLLLHYAKQELGKTASDLNLEDIGPSFIGSFLDHLEISRGNTARTRNVRLAALHSFFRYVAMEEPAYALLCHRVLAMPSKRYERKPIEYLTPTEIEALIEAPDVSSWIGRRDQTVLMLAIQTGLRVSELIGLRKKDVVLGSGAHVRCAGKGRKQHCTPLRKDTTRILDAWMRENCATSDDHLFSSVRGGALSRDAIERLVAKHSVTAQNRCSSLQRKRISPHVLRHTTAMELLRNGIDRSVIALWLGHESPDTTQMYLHADMHLKEQALARTSPLGTKPGRYRPGDRLLAFLESL